MAVIKQRFTQPTLKVVGGCFIGQRISPAGPPSPYPLAGPPSSACGCLQAQTWLTQGLCPCAKSSQCGLLAIFLAKRICRTGSLNLIHTVYLRASRLLFVPDRASQVTEPLQGNPGVCLRESVPHPAIAARQRSLGWRLPTDTWKRLYNLWEITVTK